MAAAISAITVGNRVIPLRMLQETDCISAGHAGAILQAKQLGKFLAVGIHSDEAIFENKGPTVMNLKERYS